MQLEGLFDIPPAEKSAVEWHVEIPIEDFDWNVGLIVGPSGSGKSTIARHFWPEETKRAASVSDRSSWPANKSVVDGFPKSLAIKEITGLLCSVGFSSPPSWLRPFHVLSTGEQFRVSIARVLAHSDKVIVVDEFTSVVDRTVAQIGSSAIAKTVRRRGQRFIAVTCHYDVLDWLQPDWVYDASTGAFTRRSLRRRPPISLAIRRVDRSIWPLFARHHYLIGTLSKTAFCFAAFLDDRPVAFTAAMHFMHPRSPGWREHRTVCLPDFQGAGIGNALSEFVASVFVAKGVPFRSTTSHPAMIAHRAASPLWHMFRTPSRTPTIKGAHNHSSHDQNYWRKISANDRLTASFEFVGPANPAAAAGFGIAT